MLTCPKCGHDNELGRIFCHSCGTKLDLSQIKAPSRGGKFGKKGTSIGKLINWGVQLAVLLALVWGLYLFAQVPSIRPISAGTADTAAFFERRDRLEQSIARRTPVTVTVSEAQFKAYLSTLTMEIAEGRGIRVEPQTIQVEFGDGTVTTIILGKIKLGNWAKDLYISFSGVPEVQGGAFRLKPVAGAFGKLPVHPLFLDNTSLVQGYFKTIFGRLEEKRLVDNLRSITVQPGSATLVYQPQ